MTTSGARLVETHTAYVLLLPDVALKWKKPLDLGFADFSTLAARERACADEVRLNRRLAPDVYLGLDHLTDEHGATVEPVVRMRRLPDDARLSALAAAGTDLTPALTELASTLAAFHRSFASHAAADAVAGPDRLRELWLIGLDALATDGAGIIDGHDVSTARELVLRWLDGRAPLLRERVQQGHIRDGHGDLLADDVFVLPDGVRVLDCLDFAEDLRCGDVLSDAASLLADLERLGAHEAATTFLRAYEAASGQRAPASLRHVYTAYRAQVRAKVACVRAHQTCDPQVRAEQQSLARTLLGVVLGHLDDATVRLVLVGGLPGSGKSTVANALAEQTGAWVLGADALREQVVGPRRAGLTRYSAEQVRDVYDRLLELARRELEHGHSVVLDASWADAGLREAAAGLAEQTCSTLIEVRCEVDDATARRRLAARPASHESDADAQVRSRMAERFAPWPSACTIDTRSDLDRSLRAALDAFYLNPTTDGSEAPAP